MREYLEKKWVQSILIVVVLLVWGYNMYSLLDIAAGEKRGEDADITSEFNTSNLNQPERYNYEANFKDPFQPKLTRRSSRQQAEDSTQQYVQEIIPPSLTLTGIMEAMALIQNQNQKLYFVTVGDMVEGARIRSITEDSVVLVFESKQFTLKVNN